jgi:tetratricopeptide (TPR) repeat protein
MAEEEEELERTSASQMMNDEAAWHMLGSASRDKADAYLDEQIKVARLEREKLAKEDAAIGTEIALNISHLRYRRFSDATRMALEAAGFLVVLLLISGLATMVWNATHDHDLVVEAFSVPPDLAQTGMTGTVLANRVLDRFGAMDRNTFTFTSDFSSYHSDNQEVAHVEIPDTGISLGDLNRYLQEWLGHSTHVTGELVHSGNSLSLTVRYGDEPGVTATGTPDQLDKLIQQSAENMFRAAQPLRFADYLSSHDRIAEAETIADAEAHAGDAAHRAAAYVSLGVNDYFRGDQSALDRHGQEAVQLDPKNIVAWFILVAAGNNLSHDEEEWRALTASIPIARSGAISAGASETVKNLPIEFESDLRNIAGDFKGSVEACKTMTGRPEGNCQEDNLIGVHTSYYDFAGARALAHMQPARDSTGELDGDLMFSWAELETIDQNWTEALEWSKKGEAATANDPSKFSDRDVSLRPYEAVALAHSGDVASATALIGKTALDCDICVRARGRVAAIAHDWKTAAHWFQIVSTRSPHIPFADSDWGAMLLAKGDFDGAIAKFKAANEKGPHFADPLEKWGEALMLKSRSDLALAKFAEAAKYAPGWGRLHLKWGEALFFAGNKADAKKEFAVASGLDLSTDDKAALEKWMSRDG